MKVYDLTNLAISLREGKIKKEKKSLVVALLRINEFIYDIGDLLEVSYKEGLEEFLSLDKKIRIFIERVFPKEAEKRIKEYNKDVHNETGRPGIAFLGTPPPTEENKQANYLFKLKQAKRLLEAWEYELLGFQDFIEVGKIADKVEIEKESGWRIKIPQIFEKWSTKREGN